VDFNTIPENIKKGFHCLRHIWNNVHKHKATKIQIRLFTTANNNNLIKKKHKFITTLIKMSKQTVY